MRANGAVGRGVWLAIRSAISSAINLMSAQIADIMDKALVKVDASGLLLQVNIAGHYSIENPPILDKTGWAQYKYIVEIYSNGTLLRTREYNNSSPVVHFQTPGDTNGLLAGLSAGSYTVHIIMVGNGTTHVNSDPYIRTFAYAG
jgi:hypothetical protein